MPCEPFPFCSGAGNYALFHPGATDSNSGSQYGESELIFKDPASIKSISTGLTVRRASAATCPASADFNSGTQAIIAGNFFNSGSNNAADDVQALLLLNRLPTDPPGVLEAIAFLSWQNQFFDNVDLGTVNVGQRIILRLTRNQGDHKFIAGWTDVASGTITKQPMPYNIPDTTAAAVQYKSLGVRVFTPNCIGTQPLVDGMDANFDNVMVEE